MALNIEALKQKVSKAINKLPNTVEIYRLLRNEFKEPDGEEFVIQIVGQYYKGRSSLSIIINASEAGRSKSRENEKFMTVINEDSLKVKEGDYFVFNGIKYGITDLGNTLDVYFDFSLERL